MKAFPMLLAVLVGVGGTSARATDFWFSLSDKHAAPGPAALTATVCGDVGSTIDVHVWAETDDATTTLKSFSLDVTSSDDTVFEFTAANIYNPGEAAGSGRFEFVHDSSPTAGLPTIPLYSAPDEIFDLQAYTVSVVSGSYRGLNPSDEADDETLADDAWKLATISLEITAVGTTTLQLAVGNRGLVIENSSGLSYTALANVFNATLTTRTIPTDFNGDGAVNSSDVVIWEGGYSTQHGADCTTGDANADGDVDGADFMLLQRDIGRYPALPAIAVVPEPITVALLIVSFGVIALATYRRRVASAVLYIAAIACFATQTEAQQFTDWDVGFGTWGASDNWSPPFVPAIQSPFDSAEISNGGTALVGDQVPPIRELRVTNGAVAIDVAQMLQVVETVNVDPQGALRLAAESELVVDMGIFLQGGSLTGFGKISGDVFNGGLVAPGTQENPIGTLSIDGNFSQNDNGQLRMRIDGVDNGQFDRLNVAGSVELGGELIINLANVDGLPIGQSIPIINSGGGVLEQFAAISYISSGVKGCGAFSLLDGTMTFYCPGDMNFDTVVDAGDLELFALALADTTAYETWALDNHSLQVDGAHFGNVNSLDDFNFGDILAFSGLTGVSLPAISAAVTAAQQAVPEPQTVAMTMLATLLGAVGTRRRWT